MNVLVVPVEHRISSTKEGVYVTNVSFPASLGHLLVHPAHYIPPRTGAELVGSTPAAQ